MIRATATVRGLTDFLTGEADDPPCWCGEPATDDGLHEEECRLTRERVRLTRERIASLEPERREDARAT